MKNRVMSLSTLTRETEKFVKDFVEIYTYGWQFHENFSPMDPQTYESV